MYKLETHKKMVTLLEELQWASLKKSIRRFICLDSIIRHMIKIKRMSSDALHSKVKNKEKMGEASMFHDP